MLSVLSQSETSKPNGLTAQSDNIDHKKRQMDESNTNFTNSSGSSLTPEQTTTTTAAAGANTNRSATTTEAATSTTLTTTEVAGSTPKPTNIQDSNETGFNGNPESRRDSVSSTVSTTADGRRRSKVSRACDQCRKKKIKCDYIEGSENNPDQSCTGCRKIGEKCSFERVPLKRGPSKGYTRSNSQSRERRSSQHRQSLSELSSMKSRIGSASNPIGGINDQQKQEGIEVVMHPGQSATPTGAVSLPPLLQYLPGMNQSTQHVSSPSGLQQPFWKVPYHEYQYQRRPSLDSLASDSSQKGNGKPIPQQQPQLQSLNNVRSNTGPLQSQETMRNQRYYYQSSQDSASEAGSDNRRSSSAIPPLLNPAMQIQQHQPYPYSQFTLAQQLQQHQQQQQQQ